MNEEKLRDFGSRYASAWCSQNAASVAAFCEENGSLRINAGPRSSGRAGNPVRVSGFEEWRFGENLLIVASKGHFDEADYRRQLAAK